MAESRQCLEWAVFLLVSTCFKPDLRLFKETLAVFAHKAREKAPSPLREIEDLELILACEEANSADLSKALLQAVGRLIELEISTNFPPSPTPAFQLYLNREEMLEIGLKSPFESVLQASSDPYISFSDLQSLYAMQPYQVTDLVTNPRVVNITSKEKQSGISKNLTEGEIVLDEKVVIYKGVTGQVKAKQRTSESANCYLSVTEDIIKAGQRYLLGDCLLHNLAIGSDLTGNITNIRTGNTDLLLCPQAETAYSLGRDPQCYVTLVGRKVSARHAEIVWRQGQWVLVSRGAHGTWKSLHLDYTVGRADSPSYTLPATAEIRIDGCGYRVATEPLNLRMSESELLDKSV